MIAQDAIVLAVITLLANAISGVRCEADVDFDAMKASEERALQVRLVSSTPSYPYAGNTAPRHWVTRLHVSCGARRDGLNPADGRISSNLLAAVDAAISADALLQGTLTTPLQLIGLQPDLARGTSAVGVIDAIYSCEHQTAWNTLTPIEP